MDFDEEAAAALASAAALRARISKNDMVGGEMKSEVEVEDGLHELDAKTRMTRRIGTRLLADVDFWQLPRYLLPHSSSQLPFDITASFFELKSTIFHPLVYPYHKTSSNDFFVVIQVFDPPCPCFAWLSARRLVRTLQQDRLPHPLPWK